MPDRQSRFYVDANGIRIHFLEFGTAGPPIVLIPGITSPAACWAFVARPLAAFSHVYVLDNRGRGLSDAMPGLSYTLDDYAADTARVIEALGLDRPVVLGHSMGARVGFRLAATNPGSVGRLIAVDPPVSGPGRRAYPIPLPWYLDALDKACRGEEMDNTFNWGPERVRDRAQWLPSCTREGIVASHRGFHEEDIFPDLTSVRCPTLLIYAEHGETVTEDDASEIVSRLPDGARIRIDGVGHMIPWDDLDRFVAAVKGYLT